MLFLLDTNFVSEVRKGSGANRGVQAWALSQAPELMMLSVISIAEIRKGIERASKTDLPQARALERWLAGVQAEFADRILPVTAEIADRWGRLLAAHTNSERNMLLAATALEHDLTIVTRNVDDFRGTGVHVRNPWK